MPAVALDVHQFFKVYSTICNAMHATLTHTHAEVVSLPITAGALIICIRRSPLVLIYTWSILLYATQYAYPSTIVCCTIPLPFLLPSPGYDLPTKLYHFIGVYIQHEAIYYLRAVRLL